MREATPARIGMIVPSSNTCLEPMTARMLGGRPDVTVHSTRISVTRIALDRGSDRQFEIEAMRHAAELLATAQVDVIAWNGTSGSWLGPDHDRAIVTDITATIGIPATTSTLAYLEAARAFGLTTLGLLTPYTDDVNTRIIARDAAEGVDVIGYRALGLSDNESFARVDPARLVPLSLELAESHPDALAYLCTNMYGAPIVAEVEAATGAPVLDSVAVTLWRCLRALALPGLPRQWGRLLAWTA